ncbi:MAG: TVP38/TMEM64 family protein [Halioglobus sp.]
MSRYSHSRVIAGVPARRWVALAGLLVCLFALSLYLRSHLSIDWSVDSLRAFVQLMGVWGPISYIGILVFRFLFLIPSGLLLLASGILFGPAYGAVYAGLGLTGSALWKFGVVSIVGQNVVKRQLPKKARLWLGSAATRKSSVWALAGICAYPFIPKHVFQFAAILSGMALPPYVFAVSTGSFLRAGAFAYLGDHLYSGNGIIAVTTGFLVVLVVPLFISGWRRWMFAPLRSIDSLTEKGSNS